MITPITMPPTSPLRTAELRVFSSVDLGSVVLLGSDGVVGGSLEGGVLGVAVGVAIVVAVVIGARGQSGAFMLSSLAGQEGSTLILKKSTVRNAC